MLLFILIRIFLIHERLFLIQKLLLSDHTNQTAFVCQNNKKMFSLVLSHIYMLITFLPVQCFIPSIFGFLFTVMWRKINYHGHDENKFPVFPHKVCQTNIPQNSITFLKYCGRSEVLSLVRKDVCTPLLHFIRLPWQLISTHLYSWVERGTGRVKCLVQEQNTLT